MQTQELKAWQAQWERDAIQKGRAEGKLQADRARLESLLQKRFGNMLPDIAARIEAAPQAQIDYWYDRLFDASSLAEIFAYE